MMVSIRGSLGEIEEETHAILAEQKDEIRDGQLHRRHWFADVLEQADALLRRRRSFETRREART